jgi:hypothetical protein
MSHKQQEFLNLQEGSVNVYGYSRKFNYLEQYGGQHMDTDAKKMVWFRKGLSAQLREHLTLFHSGNFNKLVSTAIEQEDASRAPMDEEDMKRNRPMSGPIGDAP